MQRPAPWLRDLAAAGCPRADGRTHGLSVGAVLVLAGTLGHAVGGRRHYF
ncbi:MAG: DUF6131 family protein [Solirubrobacteraceae bacterium]